MSVRKISPLVACLLALVGLIALGSQGAGTSQAQQDQVQAQGQAAQGQSQRQGGPDLGQAFPNLVEELKKIDGCLGVEQARTQSGKAVIFAWFEDKAAAMRWYESDYHQTMMGQFFPDLKSDGAMKDVPDDCGPVLAIASLTPATDAKVGQLPISQIAIELYTPLQGGLDIGGTFAPESVKALLKKAKDEAAKVAK